MAHTAAFLLPSTCVLGALLLVAAGSDVRSRRVSNTLNLFIVACGAVFSVLAFGWRSGASHLFAGVGLGLLIWFPMFAVRLMGAGDVKLIAACGAWLGWQGVLVASLATGVYGGILGALWLARTRDGTTAIHTVVTAIRAPWIMKMRPYEARDRLPYAVAIAGGVVTAWWMQYGSLLRGALA